MFNMSVFVIVLLSLSVVIVTYLFESIFFISSCSFQPQCHEFFVIFLSLHFQLILHILLHQLTHLCERIANGGMNG